MALRKLSAALAARAKPATNHDPADLERARRAEERSRREAETATKKVQEAEAKALAAQKERDALAIEHALATAAGEHRALNGGQVAQLVRDRYEIKDGKVVFKTDPAKSIKDSLGEWLNSDGKHFLPASVPGGGAGAPGVTSTPKTSAPADVSTAEGATQYLRDRYAGGMRKLYGDEYRPGAALTMPMQAPARPATPGAAQPPQGAQNAAQGAQPQKTA